MLFNKKIEPRCEYCRHGTNLDSDGHVICLKHGVSDSSDSCRSFVYDPLRRRPDPPARYQPREFSDEDFSL